MVAGLTPAGRAEIRRDLAGPLAVAVVALALELGDTDPAVVLGWYDEIVAAVDRVSTGGSVGPAAEEAVGALAGHVTGALERGTGMLAGATGSLAPAEVVSNAAVMMFGGIETSEGMTTSLFWHLLSNPDQLAALRADRSLAANAIEESLRLEPAAARVDRYATEDVALGDAEIRRGDLVIVSLTAANRDPDTFADPDHFDLGARRCDLARDVRPGAARLHRAAPRAARDACRARCGARRVARAQARPGRHAAERGHLPQAALAAGALGDRGRGRDPPGHQTSPGRQSQLIEAVSSTPAGVDGVRRTMM